METDACRDRGRAEPHTPESRQPVCCSRLVSPRWSHASLPRGPGPWCPPLPARKGPRAVWLWIRPPHAQCHSRRGAWLQGETPLGIDPRPLLPVSLGRAVIRSRWVPGAGTNRSCFTPEGHLTSFFGGPGREPRA